MTDTTTPAPVPALVPGPDGGIGILGAMHEILSALPAIGKNRRNEEQGFNFRGYDDVLNALNPMLAERGVIPVVQVLERVTNVRTTRAGNAMYEVNLHNRYTFLYVEDGSAVVADAWGEGTDTGDKATPKAMTGAFKYALFQVFAISTQEVAEVDADRHSGEETTIDWALCQRCNTRIIGAKSSVEPMRQHMIDVHGYVRLDDGKVGPPPKDEAPATPPQDAATPPPATDTPPAAPDAAEDAQPPAEPTPDAPADTDELDLSWVDALKGQALVAKAEELGLSKGGKVEEIRQRIRDHLTEAAAGEDEPEPEDEAPANEPELEEASADGGDDATEEGEYQCPDCNAFPFATEQEYFDHWNATHGDGPEESGEQTDADLQEVIADLKRRMTGLTGDNARKFGAYRRENGLGKPDDYTAEQALALHEFFTTLGV